MQVKKDSRNFITLFWDRDDRINSILNITAELITSKGVLQCLLSNFRFWHFSNFTYRVFCEGFAAYLCSVAG
jgi:hypothetical protein